MKYLNKSDPEISLLIQQEGKRQEHEIDLIASENYVDKAILEATGSILTNKYAEGYPGKRYYAGCEFIDSIESIAQNRCKELFNVEHANVQPHAGSSANMAIYFAMLNPGDTIMGMSLSEGGHLTHGHTVNFSGKLFKAIQYGVNRDTEELDFDEIAQKAQQYKPKLIICGASAYSRVINFEQFARIAQDVGALLMADIAHIAGLVATQTHPSPAPYADFITSTTHKTLRGPRGGLIMSKNSYADQLDKTIIPGLQGGPLMHVIAAKAVAFKLAMEPTFVEYQKQVIKNAQIMAKTFKELGYRIVTGGTDNHLFVIDLRSHNITGKIAQESLEKAGITVSKSCIPFDPEKPWITSGIRIGTPAITTRHMKEPEAIKIVLLINEAIRYHATDSALKKIKREVHDLGKQFPIYT